MDSPFPIGKCEQMCPEEEINFREKEGLLHILEIIPGTKRNPRADRNRIIKEFSRSAAGRESQNVKDLRTVDAILLTVNYLLHDVVTIEYLQWNIVYDFIMDRLRAVRQDIVIQSFQRPDTICILQPVVRFYAYAAYRLCEQPIGIFDPVINRNHLQECLKRLLCLYDDSDILITQFDLENDNFRNIKNNVLYIDSRPFMESLYLIVNLGNTTAMDRALKIPQMWRTPLVSLCLKISMDYWKGNYVRVCKQMCELPPLLFANAVLHLPSIRKKCLKIMTVAYSCKNVVFPGKALEKILLYNNLQELLDECHYYGVPVHENNIAFSKPSFKYQKPEISPKHSKFVDNVLLNIIVPDLLLCD